MVDIARAVRGISTGYLRAKVADTAAQDKLNQEFILAAKDQYYNVDKPQFVADEKKRSANIDFIATKLSPIYANYGDANNITLSDVNTRDFVNSIKDLSNEDQYKLESTIASRKKERVQSFDDKNKFIQEQFLKIKGGPGDMNMMKVFFPNEGQDIAQIGINQPDQTTETTEATKTTEPMKSVMQIEGTGSGVYNFDDHRVPRNNASNFFTGFFVNDLRQPSISFPKGTPQFVLMNELLKGYDEAEAAGFNKGKYEYARLNYIDQELKREGITGFPTGFPTTKKDKIAETKSSIPQETKSVPGDGQKFDAPDVSKIGVKEDANINIQSKRQIEGGGTGSAAVVINDLREIISKISDSPSLSDDEKEKRIEIAKDRARERIKSMGLDLDQFNI